MRELDATSIIVAAFVGGLILAIIQKFKPLFSSYFQAFVIGLIVGATVQISVRATGVS